MKKLFPLVIVAIFSFLLISCERTEYVDNSTPTEYPAVYDLKNLNFSYNNDDGWFINRTFANNLYDSDIVLIYKQTGSTNSGSPVWTALPAKFNPIVNNVTQEVYYDFDYTISDFMIYVRGSYDLSATTQYINNQTFRVVLVPAVFGGKNVNSAALNKMSYDEVIKKYNINDSKVGTL